MLDEARIRRMRLPLRARRHSPENFQPLEDGAEQDDECTRHHCCRGQQHGVGLQVVTSGRISKLASIFAVFEIIAPTAQYFVSER